MLKIDIENPKAEFFEYLTKAENGIIFSAPFGHGKSYFLDKFFKEKANDFFIIKLNPVNYSIASNEDIFRLILIDVIKHITELDEFKSIPNESINSNLITQQFISDNIADIVAAGLQLIPKIGGSLSKGLKSFKDLFEKFQDYKEKINTSWDKKALSEAHKNAYLLFENDTYLEIINEVLNKIANSRKTILLIDDLDRIDPEHIFRIFNVFSAAFDSTNKSHSTINFNSIVFVCDFENIKHVFRHKYGSEVDFSGYFNKFHHENSPYYFDNRKAVAYCVKGIMDKTPQGIKSHGSFLNSPYTGPFLSGILQILIVAKSLDLRTLEKFNSNDKLYIPNLNRNFNINGNIQTDISLRDFSITYPVHILFQLYGGYDSLEMSLKTAEDFMRHNAFSQQLHLNYQSYLLNMLFPITLYSQHKFLMGSEVGFQIPGHPISRTGNLRKGSSPSERNFFRIEFKDQVNVDEINLVSELINAIEILKQWQLFDKWE